MRLLAGLLILGSICSLGAEAQEPPDEPHIVRLVGLLASADEGVREEAGRELLASGKLGLRALLDAAGGKNLIVAEEARSVLTSAGPEAIDRLVEASNLSPWDRPLRRVEAITAVARMGPTVISRMLERFTNGNPAVDWSFAGGVLFRMRAVEVLIPLLKHPTPEVRRTVSSMLANIGDPRAYDAFIQGLRSDDVAVRMECARGLGNLGDHRAAEPLLHGLRDESWAPRQAAVAALGKIYEPRFLKPLARLARSDEEIGVRDTASNVLMYYSRDPVGVRIGKRYKPAWLSPAKQPAIQLGFAMRLGLTYALLLGLATLLPWKIREGNPGERRWASVALAVGLAAALGFFWGRVVEHVWNLIEYLLLFFMVPLAAVSGYLLILLLAKGAAHALSRRWLTIVGGLYLGYGVGWLALWGYLGL